LTSVAKRTEWGMVIILWAIGVAAAMQFAKISVSLDALSAYYSIGRPSAAATLTSIGIMGIVLGAAAGTVVGAIGTRSALVIALCIGIAASGLQAFLPSYSVLLVSRLVEGISHLLIVVAAPTAIISFSAVQHRSLTMGLWATFFGVAYTVSGLFANMLLTYGGLSALYAAHAVFLAALLALFMLLKRTPVALSKMTLGPQMRTAWRSQFAVYRSLKTSIPALGFFGHTLMFVALLTFLPNFGNTPDAQRLLATVLPIISIVGSFMGGIIAQKFGKALLQLIVSFAVFVGLSVFLWFSIGSPAFTAIACLTMFASGTIQASTFAAIPELCADEAAQAQANGAITQLGNLGATCGTPIFALGIAVMGTGAVPLLAAAIAVLATVMLLMCQRALKL